MTIEIDLGDTRALVTGAGAGIGREIARWLARAGASVAVVDVRADKAAETCSLIADEGVGEAFALVADSRDDAELERMVAEAAERLGGLDVAVNNIGMLGPRGSAPLLDLDGEAWRDVLDQNLVLTALSMSAEARVMKGRDSGGLIVNVSSGETTRPAPTAPPRPPSTTSPTRPPSSGVLSASGWWQSPPEPRSRRPSPRRCPRATSTPSWPRRRCDA